MRSAPLELAAATRTVVQDSGYPDAIFCTDMLDLPTFRGLIGDNTIVNLPTIIYFHENQWTYPVSPNARPDTHFGYTNLLSALAADRCWFNSRFHQEDFLKASEQFVARMPDAQSVHQLDRLREKCEVIPPGFQPRSVKRKTDDTDAITIGWVSRWEYDKRPDRLLGFLELLEKRNLNFQLLLLGSRPRAASKELAKIEQRYGDRILHNGYAESIDRYWELLSTMDVVVSTADHEFFGIAVCEAIWAGAVPVLPNRLSYPELAMDACLYDSLEAAAELVDQLQSAQLRVELSAASRKKIESLTIEKTVAAIDGSIEEIHQTFSAE